jgi:hypothetical protein
VASLSHFTPPLRYGSRVGSGGLGTNWALAHGVLGARDTVTTFLASWGAVLATILMCGSGAPAPLPHPFAATPARRRGQC